MPRAEGAHVPHAFKRFRKQFPRVKTFGIWNEANHVSQPLFRKPRLAARYFLAARKSCRSCTFVAADVLDGSTLEPWLGKFLRVAKGKAKVFGLHNYGDVNRNRILGTTRMLRTVPGEVWLTETGGILAVPAGLQAQPEAPGQGDEVHVPAGGPL